MPDVDQAIYQQFADQPVLAYGVHSGESPDQLEDFIEQTGITMPLIQDASTLYLFSFDDGVGYPYPRDVVIGKDGTIHSVRNSFNAEEMEALVEALLAE